MDALPQRPARRSQPRHVPAGRVRRALRRVMPGLPRSTAAIVGVERRAEVRLAVDHAEGIVAHRRRSTRRGG